MPDFDDKDLVIFAVFLITMTAMFVLGESSKDIVLNAFCGLFGVAIGKNLTKNGG